MHISALKITNFRRLKNVLIDLANDISILVGANNSGKTSAAHALQLFVNSSSREQFSVHDFNSECRTAINAFGEQTAGAVLPKISIDIWFHVEAADLHRVIDLLPSLEWQGTKVGLRIEFSALDEGQLLGRYQEAKASAVENIRRDPATGEISYHPSPCNMVEYLEEFLNQEFGLRYYVLDRARFDASFVQNNGYIPNQLIPEKGRTGKDILSSLLKIDILNAQRHLSDKSGGHRAEDLSRHLSRFYNRNLERRGNDYDAMQALSESEALLNQHLAQVFQPTLERLSQLGYPGFGNPHLLIKSALNPASLMNSHDGSAKVHYVINPEEQDRVTLPDQYNGLGFKNLIYMVVELLDRHAQWIDIEENRPPLHLIFIEEPEVHLHAQLQQVFIRKVMEILTIEGEEAAHYRSQFIVTTHSPHILYERGFRPVRYFRRTTLQASEVLNLSAFYSAAEPPTRDFLERYMKLTHCDLFFADAAILVEGNVERLLLPQMIEKSAPQLKAACLSILEVGGAFGYRFRGLIEFLGLTTLIITDIDSISGPLEIGADEVNEDADTDTDDEEEDNEENDTPIGKACPVLEAGAVTSNQTLIQWMPRMIVVADLLNAPPEQRTQLRTATNQALIRVVYQKAHNVTWGEETSPQAGRTLEEAFALENIVWCQNTEQQDLRLRIPANTTKSLPVLAERIYIRVKSSGFKKTDFALALLAKNPESWVVPRYIAEGLQWLAEQVSPATQIGPAEGGDVPQAERDAA